MQCTFQKHWLGSVKSIEEGSGCVAQLAEIFGSNLVIGKILYWACFPITVEIAVEKTKINNKRPIMIQFEKDALILPLNCFHAVGQTFQTMNTLSFKLSKNILLLIFGKTFFSIKFWGTKGRRKFYKILLTRWISWLHFPVKNYYFVNLLHKVKIWMCAYLRLNSGCHCCWMQPREERRKKETGGIWEKERVDVCVREKEGKECMGVCEGGWERAIGRVKGSVSA